MSVDVRNLLFESPQFGIHEIQLLKKAISNHQLGEVKQATTELKQRVGESGATDQQQLALGVVSHLLADHRTARTHLAAVDKNGVAAYYMGLVELAEDRFADAERSFAKAAELGYDSVLCTLLQAGAQRLQGRLDEAEALIQSISRVAVTRAEYSYQRGCLLADRGDTYGAIEYFERGVDMDPRHRGALFRLADLNNTLGNDAEAVIFYERCLAKPPFFLAAMLNLGLLYEDMGKDRAAAFCFRRVLEAHPGHARAALYLKDIEDSEETILDEETLRRERELESLLQRPISDFELSARSRNCLEYAGVQTLRDLTETTEQQLLSQKNFGETSLHEIQELLHAHGLYLGQSVGKTQEVASALQQSDLSPQKRALLESPVTDLNLSVRARKCLTRLGITMVAELVSKSADELLGVRNFGVTSLNEIRAELQERGLSLRHE